MKTTKERLATAIQVPLDESLTFIIPSLNGLIEEQVEKIATLWRKNVITKGPRRFDFEKIYESIINPLQSSCWLSP